MNPSWAAEAAVHFHNPVVQGIVAACGTFVLEDATTVGCGLLVADGKMDIGVAYIGVASGIAIGDLGLYAIGRLCGGRLLKWGWLSAEKMDRAHGWFGRNVVSAVVFSRFVPGMRTPTYLAAGVFGADVWKFLATAVAASLVWTALLMGIVASVGEAVLPALGHLKWPIAGAALLGFVAWHSWMIRRGARTMNAPAERKAAPVVSFFEFWPPWLFYLPVAAYYLCLAIKHRGLMLPMNANPSIYSSGFARESKSQILSLVSREHAASVAPWIAVDRPAGAIGDAFLDEVERRLGAADIAWPIVAKPDIG